MNFEEFDVLVNARLNKCQNTLCVKAKEYATDDNRLHNFEEAGRMQGTTSSAACLSFGMKHIISVIDIVKAIGNNNAIVTKSVIDEKIGDTINYLLLLEACITQEMKERRFWNDGV